MHEQTVYCACGCGKVVLVLRDAKTRNGFVAYTQQCDPRKSKPIETPDFLQQLFDRKRRF